ncbi:MAG: hypothetical protein JXR73_08325 [Candidatus Omnitrophica bacterium]|nr:hypothetical protein [Candidatus Omnitrophota bacterium]
MKEELPFREINEYPASINAPNMIVRMLDGLGFRFYWATEDLLLKDYAFPFSPDGKSIHDIVKHIWGLAYWMSIHVLHLQYKRPEDDYDLRKEILLIIQMLRDEFANMDETKLESIQIENQPFWHLINGPIEDAVSHTGQINVLRRIAGNPPIELNPFLGIAPK